jgi:hypothetical protein
LRGGSDTDTQALIRRDGKKGYRQIVGRRCAGGFARQAGEPADNGRFAGLLCPYSAGIGVPGAVGAPASGECRVGPRSTRSSMAIRNAMPKPMTSAQAKNT